MSYIYIYIYITGVPFPGSQGRKLQIPGGVRSAKNDFLSVPLAESTFGRLQDLAKRVQRAVLIVFYAFWELLGTSKTCDSVWYILKK